MKKHSPIHRYSARGIWARMLFLILASAFSLAFYGCTAGSDGKDGADAPTPTVPVSTVGSLSINITPATAEVVVTGPDSYSTSFTGNQMLSDLAPGQYIATGSETDYFDDVGEINVEAGSSSIISLHLVPEVSGSLNISVNPASAEVTVTGPAGFTQTFTGNQLLTGLTAGQYSAMATAPAFIDNSGTMNVVVGQTSSMSLILQPTPVIAQAPRAVYRDSGGSLVPLDAAKLASGRVIFYAWLQDQPLGIDTDRVLINNGFDPGLPDFLTEQNEYAPSFTQNLGVAWVGYMDDLGVVRPVIGADVRWEIDQYWADRVGSMQFGTSDDNRVALNTGVFDDQADTRTNSAHLDTQHFPLIVSQYPLYNQSGIATPFVDGFTWVTLFSPDKEASGRIVAVATIDGEEIGKQILYKEFTPSALLRINKEVDLDVVNLDASGDATVTWSVTVRNVGTGDATDVNVSDLFASGSLANYTFVPPAGAADVTADSFNYTFDLPATDTVAVAPPENTQLLGNAWSFGVLADQQISNSNATVVNGDVGTYAGSSITGFPPGIVLNGTIHHADTIAAAGKLAASAANTILDSRACTAGPVGPTDIGSTTKIPGVYCYSSSVALSGPLVLDAQGDPNAEFVFRAVSSLTTASASSVSLINGADPCNVYWQVGSSATLGTNSFFVGNILAYQDITANSGADISGRLIASVGEVTLDANNVNAPLDCVHAPPSTTSTNTMTFTATVNAPGPYCNSVAVASYVDTNGDTVTPVDLTDQACFTAIGSDLTIVKDFVKADNTTSLGDAITVAKNIPAKLRVRVINGGSGPATDVDINEQFIVAGSTGDMADYSLISFSNGTANAFEGFDTSGDTIAAGETLTLLFTVAASTDGIYCDEATITGSSSTPDISSDTACLTVATPHLSIAKVDAPSSVIPGATYTSTIDVSNDGAATAKDVIINDILGLNSVANVRAIYVSSSLDGVSGTVATNVVTASTIDILVGETKTFTVISRIPLGAVSGTYCDTATVTSSNAETQTANDCVNVPAYSALQTGLSDLDDPVAVGDTFSYSSVLYVEKLSNEGVTDTELTYSFGLASPTVLEIAGDFEVVSTMVYLDLLPIRDPNTGVVISDAGHPSAQLQTLGTDYTVDNTTSGLQVITMSPSVVLRPDSALYVVHQIQVPTGTATGLYTTGYVWRSVGVGSASIYQASSSEPTTVLP